MRLGLLALALACAPGAAFAQRPASTEPPPSDAAPEEARVLSVAEAALAAISAEDPIILTDLMVDEAILFSISERDGAFRRSIRSRAEERARPIGRDIVERGFDPEVRIAGGLATVWLPYDLYIDGAWSHCGVDVFSLLRVEGEWRIVAMGWSIEQPPACREHPAGPPGRSGG